MRVHILDDYDFDCEVYPEGEGHTWIKDNPLYEVPDQLVNLYKEINDKREVLKEAILLIKRQGSL